MDLISSLIILYTMIMKTIILIVALSSLQITCQSPLFFQPTAEMIPHPQKVAKGGEDAYYFSSSLLIVADGVGGWNNQGIDPGLYSKFLCKESERLFNDTPEEYLSHPEKLIAQATDGNYNNGSSTMSVVTIQGRTLRTCHIGDCKLFVLRRYGSYHLIYESTDQLHGFNFPFQLGLPQNNGDSPNDAVCGSLVVKPGDLVVLTSDGFSDNIFPNQLVEVAQKYYQQGKLDKLAQQLARLATKRANIRTGESPFSQKAREWNVDYSGGKIDDTTVIISQLISNPDPVSL